jgi:ABC-type transport system involved in cytochrome c biogenesis permease subunit
MRYFLFCLCLVLCSSSWALSPFEETQNLPVAYQGRFRSLDSAARLWLYDIYHKQQLKRDDLSAFDVDDPSALNLVWMVHFFGASRFNHSPFFWIHYASVKSLLGLSNTKERFSYNAFQTALNSKESNVHVMEHLLPYEFARNYLAAANRSQSDQIELERLSPGLWAALRRDDLIVAAAPDAAPWNYLSAGMVLIPEARHQLKAIETSGKQLSDELLQLFHSMQQFVENTGSSAAINDDLDQTLTQLKRLGKSSKEIAQALDTHFPLAARLQQAGSTLKMIPGRSKAGEWFSLHALKINVYDPQKNALMPVSNFTSFSDEQFEKIRQAYLKLESAVLHHTDDIGMAVARFAAEMNHGYASIEGTAYKEASGKRLIYPSQLRLQAETAYYRLPLIEMAIGTYALALILFASSYALSRAVSVLLLGFAIHTAVLALRCFVLGRPPVSNMFETVVYVPWIAMVTGLIFYFTSRSRLILVSAGSVSLALLILLKLTQADSRMENVQAVLDSQYWLIVHVLMVVGSYGAFAVSGILGHFFLLTFVRAQQENSATQLIARAILQTMYVGVALLIPGTILGGVWAAESWGRFWDWDPKESWAFISACVYLLVIHAYTFHKIKDFGLAVGAVAGLMAISFTWYGVNYVLGTGLHSYGFGNGGEGYYFLYLFVELLFLSTVSLLRLYNKLA